MLVATMSCVKTAEPIETPIGGVELAVMGPTNCVLGGSPDPHRKGAILGNLTANCEV